MKLVLGLTGPNGAGKGEICKYLMTKGFLATSLSDILREIAAKKGIPPTRTNLVNLGNSLREKYGSDVLARWLIRKLIKDKSIEKVVVDSIRTVGEIRTLKKAFADRFYLIHVTAPKRLRFEFIRKRNRDGDPKTYKEFLAIERKECSTKSVQQQIHKCKQLSDFVVNNNSTLRSLYIKIDKILDKIDGHF